MYVCMYMHDILYNYYVLYKSISCVTSASNVLAGQH